MYSPLPCDPHLIHLLNAIHPQCTVPSHMTLAIKKKKSIPSVQSSFPCDPRINYSNPNGGKRSVNTAIPIHPTLHCQVSASNYKTITANPRVRSLLFAKSRSLQRPKEGCTSTVRPLEGKNQDTRPLNPLAEDARTRSRSERPVFQSAAKYIEFF